MEQPSITAFFDEDWDSLSKLFSSEDATDFLYQLHGNNELCDGSAAGMFFQAAAPASFWPAGMENAENVVGENFMCYDHNNNAYNFQNVSQESSPSHGNDHDHDHSVAFTNLANDHMINIFQVMNDSSESMDFSNLANDHMVNNDQYQTIAANATNVVTVNNTENDQADTDLKRKFAKTEPEEESPKKKPRVSRNVNKNKKVAQPKPRKNQKAIETCKDDNQETNAAALQIGVQQSSCSYTSEDDSNNGSQSQESNEGEDKDASALNLNGKARASRGSATDPQSLYARKRRERINERLRILQNLIPNGTKVDISTMLEEAVHYVKFLQLQIKLLSSDDMWMYAPIVYNGLDLGVYGRIFTNQ